MPDRFPAMFQRRLHQMFLLSVALKGLHAVIELAGEGKGPDISGYRAEFIKLVRQAKNARR